MRAFSVSLLLALSVFLMAPSASRADSDAVQFVNDLGHKALAIVTDSANSLEQRRAKLEKLFTQNVDIDWVAQFVLGRSWKEATPEQKARYRDNYRTFIIKHYTSNLGEFTDANFQVTKSAPTEQGGEMVTMRIKRKGKEDVITDYAIRKGSDGHLKVYDIVVEGVSLITTQRSEFNSVVSQKGLDYLIDQLAARSQREE